MSPCPVFAAARAFHPVTRVLIAFDGRTASLAAVDHVARDPLFAGTEVDVLTVGGEEAAARRALDAAKGVLEAGGHRVRADLLSGGAESVIAAEIEARGIDLLVMGASGRSRLRQLFIGSTTAEMIRSCKVPVLVWR
jgi:nucleotide-binding universal stress UspA family protein